MDRIEFKPECYQFLELGDQWLSAYAFNYSGAPGPTLFLIGHCLEAYCKSAISALNSVSGTNPVTPESNGHEIGKMIGSLQERAGILNKYQVSKTIGDKYLQRSPIPYEEAMSDPNYHEFVAHQELYWVSYFQKNIKYLGTPGRFMPTSYSLTVMPRNPYWITPIKELRSFIARRLSIETLSYRSYLTQVSHDQNVNHFLDGIFPDRTA